MHGSSGLTSLNCPKTLPQALEESLAEVCRLDLESDWQREVVERLQKADAERERSRGGVEELQRQTGTEEQGLVNAMREEAHRKVRNTQIRLRIKKKEGIILSINQIHSYFSYGAFSYVAKKCKDS